MNSRSNHLFTLAYFRMRLKEYGYNSKILIRRYNPKMDNYHNQYWAIEIDPGHRSLICICFKETKECYFTITDGTRLHEVHTDSMSVVFDRIDRFYRKDKE